MRIFINGEAREVEPGVSLLGLLDALGIDPRRVAVAVNAAVVPRAELATRSPAAQDRIEIIEAVGGG